MERWMAICKKERGTNAWRQSLVFIVSSKSASYSVTASTSVTKPALVVADQHDTHELLISIVRVRLPDGQRAIRSTTTELRQPVRQTQDRVGRIDLRIKRLRIERHDDAVRITPQECRSHKGRDIHAPQFRRAVPAPVFRDR
jgi:hypothetical protein